MCVHSWLLKWSKPFSCTLCILHSVKIKQKKKGMSKERNKSTLVSNVFCYIYGRFTTLKERRKITVFIQKACHSYFGVKLGGQDKSWTPHRICASCVSILILRTKGKNISLLGFLWYGECRKIILMFATFAVSTFQG